MLWIAIVLYALGVVATIVDGLYIFRLGTWDASLPKGAVWKSLAAGVMWPAMTVITLGVMLWYLPKDLRAK